jgi:hypothetical protein
MTKLVLLMNLAGTALLVYALSKIRSDQGTMLSLLKWLWEAELERRRVP